MEESGKMLIRKQSSVLFLCLLLAGDTRGRIDASFAQVNESADESFMSKCHDGIHFGGMDSGI